MSPASPPPGNTEQNPSVRFVGGGPARINFLSTLSCGFFRRIIATSGGEPADGAAPEAARVPPGKAARLPRISAEGPYPKMSPPTWIGVKENRGPQSVFIINSPPSGKNSSAPRKGEPKIHDSPNDAAHTGRRKIFPINDNNPSAHPGGQSFLRKQFHALAGKKIRFGGTLPPLRPSRSNTCAEVKIH
jgi:hypothetical protein